MNRDDQEIDLLVDGELDEEARRVLLEKLDAEPDGWRRCALAFLEAQTWQSASRSIAREAPIPVLSLPKPARNRAALIQMGKAAAVLMVFAIGWLAGRNREGSHPVEVARTSQPPIVTASQPSPPETALTRPPGYVEAKLEREGFRVERRVLMVPVQTAGGQRLAVPVEQTKVRFIGNRAT